MVELIYCAAGGKRYAEIAIRHGYTYGAQLPNSTSFPPEFVDQDYKNPNLDAYVQAVAQHRPRMATVLDYDENTTLAHVLEWAQAIASHVTEAIIIIPKISGTIHDIPVSIRDVPVRLGYSVPTTFGATSVPMWEFGRRPVHLLGGAPHRQYELAQYLNVVSADGNQKLKMANGLSSWYGGGSARYAKNRFWPQIQDVYEKDVLESNYLAFELSCMNIKAMWRGCGAAVRFARAQDIASVKRIANQYKNELGFVMLPKLYKSLERRELYVAEYNRRVVGFCNWHLRKDGRITIYEIAVDKAHIRQRIGAGLLASLPAHPTRLKCTTDNPANHFYAAVGYEHVSTEGGRTRPLNVWYHSAAISG